MPCWVVPAVAAEFWGISVEQVLADVAAGRLAVQTEAGLLFVSVATSGEVNRGPVPRAEYRRSLAWAMPRGQGAVSAAEQHALLSDEDNAHGAATMGDSEMERAPAAGSQADFPESVHDEGEPAPLEDGLEEGASSAEPATEESPEWQPIRSRVGRTRRPPQEIRDAA